MVRVIPGGVVDAILGENQGTPEERERIERDLGLDKPDYEQYFTWLGGVVRLDFGDQLRVQDPVSDRMKDALPTTIELSLLALLISLIIALPIGVLAAIRQDSIWDYIARSVSIGFLAIPSFWLGTMIIVFASVWFSKATPLPQDYHQIWESPWLNLKFMLFPYGYFIPVGPAVLLGVSLSGTVMRLTRAQMLEVLRQDYVRTAWAKGLQERNVVVAHALKNAMIPVITVIGLQLPILIGGSIVVETIYNVPGIGKWLIEAITSRDYTSIQAIAMLTAVTVVFTNLAVDLTYGYLDPRIRYS
jgi:peptide/nickel transport system permease protein